MERRGGASQLGGACPGPPQVPGVGDEAWEAAESPRELSKPGTCHLALPGVPPALTVVH